MEISEVRIRRIADQGNLLAFYEIVFEEVFVLHDLRLIRVDGRSFVAMPNRELTHRCACGASNCCSANFCGYCGQRLRSRKLEYRDVASPINAEFRAYLEDAVIREYEADG